MAIPRRLLQLTFALYALALFIATHWPKLAIDSPVQGTDKLIHATVFLIWTLLLAAATSTPSRRPPLHQLALIATLYACLDEGLQAIPALGRTCSWADLLANLTGIAIAAAIIALRRRLLADTRPLTEAPSP